MDCSFLLRMLARICTGGGKKVIELRTSPLHSIRTGWKCQLFVLLLDKRNGNLLGVAEVHPFFHIFIYSYPLKQLHIGVFVSFTVLLALIVEGGWINWLSLLELLFGRSLLIKQFRHKQLNSFILLLIFIATEGRSGWIVTRQLLGLVVGRLRIDYFLSEVPILRLSLILSLFGLALHHLMLFLSLFFGRNDLGFVLGEHGESVLLWGKALDGPGSSILNGVLFIFHPEHPFVVDQNLRRQSLKDPIVL